MKSGIQRAAFIATFLFIFQLVSAAELPVGSRYDNRIRYVTYNPDDVVVVKTRIGDTTLIQLEEGEKLVDLPNTGLSIGDKEAWSIGVRGHNIFLKAAGQFPDTNINLVTNKRTYAISLKETKKVEETIWILRFKYPVKEPTPQEKSQAIARAKKKPCSNGPVNLNWFKYGDQSLAPAAVWDDGRFTCFKFPTSKSLPAIYRYAPDSSLKEALVPFNVKDDVIVVHEVAEEFRLRLGNKVLGIKTDSLQDSAYNFNKTSTGEKRVKLDEK